jgi:hypothetical protein
MIKEFSISYLVYMEIWLNLPRDDCHFLYIFLWMIANLATKHKFLKKNSEPHRRSELGVLCNGRKIHATIKLIICNWVSLICTY